MKRRWLLFETLLSIILILSREVICDVTETTDELSKLIDSIENFPRATIPELEELDQLSELEEALDNENNSKDQEYAEELLKAIKSVREKYDELREKWQSTMQNEERNEENGEKDGDGLEETQQLLSISQFNHDSIHKSNSFKKPLGPLSRARAFSSHTIFQTPISPPSGWADFENDAEFEEISAPDMKIPESEIDRMEERTTTFSNVQFIPKEEIEFSTSFVTTNNPITIAWKSRTQPPPPKAPLTWTSQFIPKSAKEEANEKKDLPWNDPKGIEIEITALMDLWEKGPLSERLRAADDQRIERILSKKDLDRHAKNILLGKRRLRRLLILSRLFEDRSRILILIEAQRHALKETIKRAQHRIPKSAPKQERKDQIRQVSRSRVSNPPSQMFETRWPAVRESFQAPVFNPSTDTLDTAVERGFVETDPEFFGRRPRRKLNNRPSGQTTNPLFARLLKVQNRKGIDERNAKIISLRGESSQSEETGRRKGPLKMANNHKTTENVKKIRHGDSREKSEETEREIENVEKPKAVKIRSSKPDPSEILEMCQQIECDFEKGDLCNWESSADQLDEFERRHKREEEFSIRSWKNVGGRPDRAKAMERNSVFSSINTHFAGAYVNGSQVATLTTRITKRIPISVRFLAWEATRMLRLRMCCDDFCPFSTEEGVKRGHRKWIAHTVICPANTKQITFECVNTGEWSGRCGLDSIHFPHPQCPQLLPLEIEDDQ
ncbi:unnamed protein product, partial [Mesorhabditis belari]|uniref:Uncharacterized protein n=1 Tax=Mesorhabditis belari TaxID=2138241 RepID=A0AAF3FC01_9BILA